LTFTGARQWRLGPTNDEGWYRGQCRYVGIAPKWESSTRSLEMIHLSQHRWTG
jgi:hypothetical protein